jgi:hypothetical protein
MSGSASPAVLTETTEQGEQMLVPGVAPVGLRARLEHLLGAPLRSSKRQKPLNIGLGACPWAGQGPDPRDEDARNQLNLF